MTIKFTRFRKFNGSLTKVLSLLPTGEVRKDSAACAMSSGEFETLSISHVRDLVGVLTNIKKTECLGYGACRVRAAGKIVAQDKAGPLDTTRTKENFPYTPSCPALLMLDYDGPSGRPLLSKDEWLGRLYEACPAFKITDKVWRPSTTSFIYDKDGRELRGLTGQRLYVVVADGADIPRAGETLFKRLWLAGYGHIELSKAGSFLKRTLIDASVFSPERLDFVAGAVCRNGLWQDKDKLTPLYTEGTVDKEIYLNTQVALALLSVEEEVEFQRLVEAVKAQKMGEAKKVRAVYIDDRSEEIAKKRGIPIDTAKRVVEAAISERADLYPDFMLKFERHGWVSVADVMGDLPKYDGATLADPLEPEYDGGRTVARVYANTGKGEPVIHSFAHGDKTYHLHSPADEKASRATKTSIEEAWALLDALNSKDPGVWFEEKALDALSVLYALAKLDFERAILKARKAKASIKDLKEEAVKRARKLKISTGKKQTHRTYAAILSRSRAGNGV